MSLIQTPPIKTQRILVAKLRALVKERMLPIHNNSVARGPIEIMLGLPQSALRGEILTKHIKWEEVICAFESDLKKKEGGNISCINYKYGTPRKLKKLLVHWQNEKNYLEIPFKDGSQDGAIKNLNVRTLHSDYGFPLNFPYARKWFWAVKLLNQFNDEMYKKGVLGNEWERRVNGYRKLLEALRKKGSLPVSKSGRLNRRFFLREHAGVTTQINVYIFEKRAPKLKELFLEYDEIIRKSGLTGINGDKYIDQLKEIIAGKKYRLTDDKKSISWKHLANMLRVEPHVVRRTKSLRDLLSDEEKNILKPNGKTKKSFNVYGVAKLNAGILAYSETHDLVFNFSDLVDHCGLELTEKIATAFLVVAENQKSPKQWFRTIKEFLKYISDPSSENGYSRAVFLSLQQGTRVEKSEFNYVCMAFKRYLHQIKPGAIGFNVTVITEYGKAKIFPEFVFPRNKRASQAYSDRSRRPSIAEASINDSTPVTDALIQGAMKSNLHIDCSKDTEAFVSSILDEKSRRNDLPDDLVESIKIILKERLRALRIQATEHFLSWEKQYEEGKNIIDVPLAVQREVCSNFSAYKDGSNHDFISEYLPYNNKERSIRNLLIIVANRYGGNFPRSTDDNNMWSRFYRRVGGVEPLRGFLSPTCCAVSSALTLYLCVFRRK